jgi:predicted DNA-binding protein
MDYCWTKSILLLLLILWKVGWATDKINEIVVPHHYDKDLSSLLEQEGTEGNIILQEELEDLIQEIDDILIQDRLLRRRKRGSYLHSTCNNDK